MSNREETDKNFEKLLNNFMEQEALKNDTASIMTQLMKILDRVCKLRGKAADLKKNLEHQGNLDDILNRMEKELN